MECGGRVFLLVLRSLANLIFDCFSKFPVTVSLLLCFLKTVSKWLFSSRWPRGPVSAVQQFFARQILLPGVILVPLAGYSLSTGFRKSWQTFHEVYGGGVG